MTLRGLKIGAPETAVADRLAVGWAFHSRGLDIASSKADSRAAAFGLRSTLLRRHKGLLRLPLKINAMQVLIGDVVR